MLLHEKLHGRRLILASRSPRRRQLLEWCGLPFTTCDYQVEEHYPPGMDPREVPLHVAGLKSAGYPDTLAAGDILLTADTVVICDDRILGKPRDEADARRMLGLLSGRSHTVATGVVLRSATRERRFGVTSEVFFRRLTDEEIAWYVATCRPLDKAGAYGIQEWIGCAAVERIEGSFQNVMGLPVQRLYVELNQFIDNTRP